MTTHIIGAGLAGLSAATALASAGHAVTLYEAGPAAGGRCRSYHDAQLGCRIDNGNHLLLSGNRATSAYLARIGATGTLHSPAEPLFPFLDLPTGDRWTLRPNFGRLPWWIFAPSRRVPGTKPADYLQLLRLRRPRPGQTVAAVLDPSTPLYRRQLAPLAIAALNTPPDTAVPELLAAVMAETLLRGGAACIPLVPRIGLSETFVDPALAHLATAGATIHLARRIAALRITNNQVTALETPDGPIPLAAADSVILAVPPWVAADLLPGLTVPDAFESILNIHARIDAPPTQAGFLGLIGATSEWIFIKPGIVSVTISAANRLADLPADAIAARVWPEIRAALSLPEPMPPIRVIKERRATFAATAAMQARRHQARTHLTNLALAGDWTATALPATIEGAIRSGETAANLLRTLQFAGSDG